MGFLKLLQTKEVCKYLALYRAYSSLYRTKKYLYKQLGPHKKPVSEVRTVSQNKDNEDKLQRWDDEKDDGFGRVVNFDTSKLVSSGSVIRKDDPVIVEIGQNDLVQETRLSSYNMNKQEDGAYSNTPRMDKTRRRPDMKFTKVGVGRETEKTEPEVITIPEKAEEEKFGFDEEEVEKYITYVHRFKEPVCRDLKPEEKIIIDFDKQLKIQPKSSFSEYIKRKHQSESDENTQIFQSQRKYSTFSHSMIFTRKFSTESSEISYNPKMKSMMEDWLNHSNQVIRMDSIIKGMLKYPVPRTSTRMNPIVKIPVSQLVKKTPIDFNAWLRQSGEKYLSTEKVEAPLKKKSEIEYKKQMPPEKLYKYRTEAVYPKMSTAYKHWLEDSFNIEKVLKNKQLKVNHKYNTTS